MVVLESQSKLLSKGLTLKKTNLKIIQDQKNVNIEIIYLKKKTRTITRHQIKNADVITRKRFINYCVRGSTPVEA